MKNKLFIILVFSLLFLTACQGTKDALQGKTRADKSDEFLVEKKNPLSMPPDINELPLPTDSNIKLETNQDDIKNKLKVSNKKDINKSTIDTNSSLNSKVLEKIKE